MWDTSCGKRTLKDIEATLFAETLWDLIDETNLNDEDDYILGVHVFDKLTYGQKISVLSIVGNGLLRKDVPCVPLTAVLEGAIAAVFEHLKNCIIFEIDVPDVSSNWRKTVVAARKEAGGEQTPLSNCEDLEEWGIEVDSLAEAILWDADYDDENLFIDDAPEKAKMLMTLAGISNNYFVAIADDLEEGEIAEKLTELRGLCRSRVERR